MLKVQVNLSDDIVLEIDKYAKMMGVSRSALCAIFIGQGILGYHKSFELMGTVGEKLGSEIAGMIDSFKASGQIK